MFLSDLSVTRPVFGMVLGMLLVVFGIVSFTQLPLRQYPDIDPPVVTVETSYPGAAASIVESRITEIIEDRISGIEGVDFIQSSSEDGESNVTIQFKTGRDVDAAANDVRDRVSRILNNLPEEANPPEVQKRDANQDVIVWLSLSSPEMSVLELTDFAERYVLDRFSVLPGVARVRLSGAKSYAMRIWLDRLEMAARGLTASDVERALRAENVELPAGSVESLERQFTVRVARSFNDADDFSHLVLARGDDGYLVRLGDIARVERAAAEDRTFFRGNTLPRVGIGIVKQSTANTIDVARGAKAEADRLNPTLPEGMSVTVSFDTSIFVEGAINEVYKTLAIAMVLVVLVILAFLGNLRAMLVPAVTVPISIIASFTLVLILGFSINLLTLLALVLAIGLVVDDSIVVLENIQRRMDELKETPLVAAFEGTRQVGFAVIATTMVLISVFVPIAFTEGDIGRLFAEFALTMAAAVAISSLVALTISPMIASKILKPNKSDSGIGVRVEALLLSSRDWYAGALEWSLSRPLIVGGVFVVLLGGTAGLFGLLPSEYSPREDRGAFFIIVNGPQGATHDYMSEYMDEIEARLVPYLENEEMHTLLVRSPRSFGNITNFNTGIVICVLNDWSDRRSAFVIIDEVRQRLSDLPGVRAFPVMSRGFGGGSSKPVQFVIGGGTYDEIAHWRDIILDELETNNPGLGGLDWDYKETQPQVEVDVDYDRAAELGVTVSEIGRTLETMLGSRRVTTYIDGGEEYDVILEGERDAQRTPTDMQNIYVRSTRSDRLIPLSNLVTIREFAGSTTLNRYNRVRAITLEANLEDGLSLGDAIAHLNQIVDDKLPETVVVDYKGESRDFFAAGGALLFVFLLGIAIVFLVLSAQFESFVHPLIIMLTVPVVIGGGLLGLWMTGSSLNIYSQIGLVMLVGLAAKNGILIVEFANQLRDQGVEFADALREASITRFRPILMTGITTAAGTFPLILGSGAGAETRAVIGIVVLAGVLTSVALTLFVVPVAYNIMARNTGSPGDVRRRLFRERPSSQPAE
ncbi:efflux RND transporter permease subunit [Pyruvatibacter sp.]|uniref:efflux RND transporter permease subunit n=1 Tax=Pyruvatibacter sp. TaxID=1981328 RepID=UPI0032660E94